MNRNPYLFNKINTWLEVQSEINELPLNSLCPILLLLQNEHGMVEELLEFLVRVVDAQLLKRVELEDFET